MTFSTSSSSTVDDVSWGIDFLSPKWTISDPRQVHHTLLLHQNPPFSFFVFFLIFIFPTLSIFSLYTNHYVMGGSHPMCISALCASDYTIIALPLPQWRILTAILEQKCRTKKNKNKTTAMTISIKTHSKTTTNPLDPAIQKPAEEQLMACEAPERLQEYYTLLGTVLSNQQFPEGARTMAMIRLKQTVSSRSTSMQKFYDDRWLSQDANLRTHMHALLLSLLDSPTPAIRKTSVETIVAMACAEIPRNQWLELLHTLTNATIEGTVSANLRCSSIEIIGEICKRLSNECAPLAAATPSILHAILVSAGLGQPMELRVEAISALHNSIKFCDQVFENLDQRKALMELMIGAAQPIAWNEKTFEWDYKLQAAGWDCLINVVGYYYQHLNDFMMQIFNVSVAAIQQSLTPGPQTADEEAKAATELASIQAIEFWSQLALNEFELEVEQNRQQENDEPSEIVLKDYCQHAVAHIVPLLLRCMCLQPESADDDSFNITISSLNCLQEFAKVCNKNSDLFTNVIPGVQSNIASPDWRFRDAACTALGSVVCSPYLGLGTEDSKAVLNTLLHAMDPILNLCADPELHVATSAAWALSQYCIYLANDIKPIMDQIFSRAIIPSLTTPRTRPTQNICRAIYELCDNLDYDQEKDPHPLTPYFDATTNLLIAISGTSKDAVFLVNSYEALTELIHCGAGQQSKHLLDILTILGGRLHQSISQFDASSGGGNEVGEYKTHTQGLICAALAASIASLPPETVLAHVDNLYNVFASVLTSDPTVVVDALMGIDAIVVSLGEKFDKHAPAVFQRLIALITEHREVPSIVARCFGVCGSLISHTPHLPVEHADLFAQVILQVLAQDSSGEEAKLAAIESVGDLALRLDHNFARYYDHIISSLMAALAYSITKTHQEITIDLVDYLLALQIATLNALDAITLALCQPENGDLTGARLLAPQVESILQLCMAVIQDTEFTMETQDAAFTLMNDLLVSVPAISKDLCRRLVDNQDLQQLRHFTQRGRADIKKKAMQAVKTIAGFAK